MPHKRKKHFRARVTSHRSLSSKEKEELNSRVNYLHSWRRNDGQWPVHLKIGLFTKKIHKQLKQGVPIYCTRCSLGLSTSTTSSLTNFRSMQNLVCTSVLWGAAYRTGSFPGEQKKKKQQEPFQLAQNLFSFALHDL